MVEDLVHNKKMNEGKGIMERNQVENRTPSCFHSVFALFSRCLLGSLSGCAKPMQLRQAGHTVEAIVEQNNYIPENTPNSIAAGIVYYVSIYCNSFQR